MRITTILDPAPRNVGGIRAAYADANVGDALALVNSMSLLEVAVMAGRACEALAAGVGAEVRVTTLHARPADAGNIQE